MYTDEWMNKYIKGGEGKSTSSSMPAKKCDKQGRNDSVRKSPFDNCHI